MTAWLSAEQIGTGTASYALLLHEIDPADSEQARREFREFAEVAFEDVRSHLRTALTPLGASRQLPSEAFAGVDPAAGFPSRLHDTVKKGILGELWAGFLAERVAHDSQSDWRVPKFLFRFHKGALDQLQRAQSTDTSLTPIPGRLGDDCIAVRLEGDEVCLLVAESKCTGGHSSALLKDAHRSFKANERLPADLINLISILREYDDDESVMYLEALQRCYVLSSAQPPRRIDYLVYVCGQRPVRNRTWIAGHQPSSEYTGGRRLEASEIHLGDANTWLEEVLGP